ncbi:MAG TPA: phytanoyl-CoA dioxygenase family protein [Blastocatellia bacterium]|nr:phytanoyl-CoA dioxygenase family protein [Blastocatellia bacterium]
MMLRNIRRAARNNEFTWRYIYNLAPSLSYQFSRPSLSEEGRRVVAALNRDGVAVTSVHKLLGVNSAYEQLSSEVERLERDLADRLSDARAAATGDVAVGKKSFIYMLLGDCPSLDPESIYAGFALQEPILRIANAYFGMYTRLRYYNVWHTFPTRGEARESQLWHRDREDQLILKMFLYLSDIDEGAGPFTYAPGSHRKGRRRCNPDYFVEGVVKRSNDEQMARVVPAKEWIKCTGPKGTIVFADTAGYHKGGEARDRDRIMYTCMFTSPASESQELLKRGGRISAPQSREMAVALAAQRRGAWLRLSAGS